MEEKKLIGHWSFSISHFSFAITSVPLSGGVWLARQIEPEPIQMTNEKWKMTNDQ